MTDRNIIVAESVGTWIEDRAVEIVERKGIGHPDSLCDGIAERISVEYTKWCKENLDGKYLHHNFDKVQLVAGDVDVSYGHAQLLKPIRIQIAGRGTPEVDGRKVPMDTIAIEAAKAHISETMKYLDPNQHCVIDCFAGRGASELIHAVDDITANDTSFGAAHWPRSVLENAVYETCEYITGNLINQFPLGEDVKVMGCRNGDDIVLTCAVPFLSREIKDVGGYIEVKQAVRQAVQAYAEKLAPNHSVTVDVNTADVEEEDAVYMTLTGTSAEMGDDGSVGRGNRVTGVIAPFRAASLEAASGKNPISHVGKLYNVLALLTAQDIVEKVDEVREAQVYMLSQIGKPLDQPLVATATVKPTGKTLSAEAKNQVKTIIDANLQDMVGLREKLANREVTLY